MGQIYIEIGNLDSLVNLLAEAKKKGLLKDISIEKVERAFKDKAFPMKIPVSVDGVLDLCGKPMLRKMYGKKLETGVLTYLEKALGAG